VESPPRKLGMVGGKDKGSTENHTPGIDVSSPKGQKGETGEKKGPKTFKALERMEKKHPCSHKRKPESKKKSEVKKGFRDGTKKKKESGKGRGTSERNFAAFKHSPSIQKGLKGMSRKTGTRRVEKNGRTEENKSQLRGRSKQNKKNQGGAPG